MAQRPSYMEQEPASHSLDEQSKTLIRTLPTCERCKSLRRRCDTELPSCRLCTAANAPCEVKDQVLQTIIPRSHIKALLDRWMALREEEAALQPVIPDLNTSLHSPLLNPESGITGGSTSDSYLSNAQHARRNAGAQSLVEGVEFGNGINPVDFDGHYPAPSMDGVDFLYFGSASAVALSTEVLLQACPQSTLLDSTRSLGTAKLYKSPAEKASADELVLLNTVIPSEALVTHLLETYSASINILYPLVSHQTIEEDLVVIRESLGVAGLVSGTLRESDPYPQFRISVVCSIACAIQLRQKPWMMAYEQVFYARALDRVEEVIYEISGRSLQALMLIIIYYLFRPQKGDIWMLLDSASRLCVELGYHAEEIPEPPNDEKSYWKRNAFWTLYTIERMVAQSFGRPSDTLEAIMSVKYPDPNALDLHMDGMNIQRNAAAQIYQLAFLRSEIFSELYLTSSNSRHDRKWYREQYFRVLRWYREAVTIHDPTGMGIVACNLAYHSAVLLLFQKSLLTTLSEIGRPRNSSVMAIETDNYWAACQIIQIYEEILHSGYGSQLENYPLTFVAAHEIYTAGLTVLAHCILSIDGKVMTLEPYEKSTITDDPKTQAMDYSTIHHISASCLSLLTWCATQWSGMEGMLEIYKEVSATVLPKLVRLNLG